MDADFSPTAPFHRYPARRTVPLSVSSFLVPGCLALLVIFSLTGCSSRSYTTYGPRDRDAVPAVRTAVAQLGAPYRYGGQSPAEGFDCSGLVYYAYRQAGTALPRTAREQYARLPGVRGKEIAPGDLVFFRLPGKSLHVGLYLGGERFIHAPSHGKRVSYASLGNPFWRQRFVGGRRVP